MGVRKLTSYLRRHAPVNVYRTTSLDQWAQQWHEQQHPGVTESPALLIQARCLQMMFFDDVSRIGNWQNAVSSVRYFVHHLNELRVKPVFVCTSQIHIDCEVWLYKTRIEAETIRFLRDALWDQYLFSILKSECAAFDYEVVVIPSERYSPIVARYLAAQARNLGASKCLGVLSDDSDMAIHNMVDVPWLSVNSEDMMFESNYNAIKVNVFDQWEFMTLIGCPKGQNGREKLALVACLLGNDYTSEFYSFGGATNTNTSPLQGDIGEKLKNYHAKLNVERVPHDGIAARPPYFLRLMRALMKEHAFTRTDERSLGRLETQITGVNNRLLYTGIENYKRKSDEFVAENIVGSVPMLPELWQQLTKMVERGDMHLGFLPIFCDTNHFASIHISKESLGNLPSHAEMLLTAVKRLYSFCLGPNIEVSFYYTAPNHDCTKPVSFVTEELCTSVNVSRVFAPNADRQDKMCALKTIWEWELVANLPTTMDVVELMVKYIQANGCNLTDAERASLIRTFKIVHEKAELTGLDEKDASEIDDRMVQLNVLILEWLSLFHLTVVACNKPIDPKMFMPWNVFDGPTFRKLLKSK